MTEMNYLKIKFRFFNVHHCDEGSGRFKVHEASRPLATLYDER